MNLLIRRKERNPFSIQAHQPGMLIRNESKVTKDQFTKLTLNFTPGAKTRVEMLEDRPHTVIPMVMLVAGVHHGSGGPVLYTEEEMSKTPQVWDHKPIVVYHPELNGEGISACKPEIVNSRKVGVIMNTRWDPKLKRLPAEAWLEETRADKVDKRVFEGIRKNEMMELSTGLFVDLEMTEGKLGDEEYNGITRNYRPDHLALLPDKIGACSIADGAGFLRNEMRKGKMAPKDMLRRLTNVLGLTDNEMSHENIRGMIQAALRTKLNIGNDGPWVWVEAVYSNFFVYEKDGKLFRLDYEASDTGVTISDEKPVEVVRQVEFRTVEGAKFVGNLDQQQQNNESMNKVQMIAAILAANCGWSDKTALEGLSDKQVESIHNGIKKEPAAGTQPGATTNQTPPATTPAATVQTPTTATTNAGATTEPKKVLTMEEYLGQMPPEMAGIFRGMMAANASEEATLIDKITKNASMGFSKEDLKGMPIGNLRKLAKLADVPTVNGDFVPVPAPDFSGMAPLGNQDAAALENAEGGEEEVLQNTAWDFSKGKKGEKAAVAAA